MIVPVSGEEAAQRPSDADVPCPACGAPLGGRAGCQTAFDALCARAWETPERGAVHNLAVDAYCLQHPEDYCVSAKSYAAHLAGLACGLAPAVAQTRYWAIARWLDGARSLERPTPSAERGAVTIAAVSGGSAGAAYGTAVRVWAEAVWRAYAAQHALAERWLADALAAAEHTGTRRAPGRSGAPAP